MSALLLVRDALVSGLAANPLLAGVQVSAHGGDFTAEDLARYGKRAPALVIALLKFTAELEDGSIVANARWGMVAITKNAPAVAVTGAPAHASAAATAELHTKWQHASVIALADVATRCLMRFFYGYAAPANMTVSAPRNFVAINEYSPKLDAQAIALWGLAWEQRIDLVDTAIETDFTTLQVQYDLYPRPDGEDLGEVVEAEDLLEDLDV